MNKKIYNIISILLLIVILIISYVYMNLPENFRLQLGGVEPGKIPIPPECLPFMYKYRYIFYIAPIFLLLLIILYGIRDMQNSSLTYSDFGKIMLSKFKNDTEAKNKNTISPEDLEIYNRFLEYTGHGKQFGANSQLFCFINSPCSCCDVPGYKNQNLCKKSSST